MKYAPFSRLNQLLTKHQNKVNLGGNIILTEKFKGHVFIISNLF